MSHPGFSAYDVLRLSVRDSEIARVAYDAQTQEPLVVFGVQRSNLLAPVGIIWLLGTGRAGKMAFARRTKRMLPLLFENGIDTLTNVVWTEYRDCVKWLEWLGARFADSPCQGDHRFVQFYIPRDAVEA